MLLVLAPRRQGQMGQHLHPIKEPILLCFFFKPWLPLTYKNEHPKDNFTRDVGVPTILLQAELYEFEASLVLHREFQASHCYILRPCLKTKPK